MRQTLARWRTGMRTRLLDTWWLVREGPRAAFRRSLVGSVLVVALLVVVAFDVVLLFRAMRDQPASTVPAGIPTGIVSIMQDEDASLIDEPVTDPVMIPPADQEREEEEGRADEEKGNDRREEDRPSPASDGGESATSPSDAPTSPSGNDGTNDQPPASEPAPSQSPDTGDTGGGTGPGGSGPGDEDGGDTGGGDTGGGGGGGG